MMTSYITTKILSTCASYILATVPGCFSATSAYLWYKVTTPPYPPYLR